METRKEELRVFLLSFLDRFCRLQCEECRCRGGRRGQWPKRAPVKVKKQYQPYSEL
jgi:hypothetical protein